MRLELCDREYVSTRHVNVYMSYITILLNLIIPWSPGNFRTSWLHIKNYLKGDM